MRRIGNSLAEFKFHEFGEADMVMKVKEPIEREWPHMRQGQLIFTYFHFAADEGLTRALIDSGAQERASREAFRAAYERALALTRQEAEKRFLEKRLAELNGR